MKLGYLLLLVPLTIIFMVVGFGLLLLSLIVFKGEFGLLIGFLSFAAVIYAFVWFVIPRAFKETIAEYWKEHPNETKTE